tara:strand:- start:187 stop:684 length:498 start_codon:yes stop_codon:yes gene_type:complete
MLRLPKVAMPIQPLLKRYKTSKAIVPYQSSLEKINPAFSDVPILYRAFNYLTTAPEIGHMDIIYFLKEHDDRLLDASIYKDFKQDKYFFSVHFNPTDKGIQFYKNTVKRIIELESPYNYTYQPHFGKVEIAIEIEQPNVMNGRRVIRPIHLSANTSLFLEKKPTK